jgi:hypothetical protein
MDARRTWPSERGGRKAVAQRDSVDPGGGLAAGEGRDDPLHLPPSFPVALHTNEDILCKVSHLTAPRLHVESYRGRISFATLPR